MFIKCLDVFGNILLMKFLDVLNSVSQMQVHAHIQGDINIWINTVFKKYFLVLRQALNLCC